MAMTAASSSPCVLAAIQTGRIADAFAEAGDEAAARVGSAAMSYFRLPVTAMAAGAAPRRSKRSPSALRLRQHAAQRAQRARDQRPQHPIAAQRALRQPRVDDVRRHAVVAAAEQQVRPQLGFQHQRQPRPEMREEARDRAGQVVRQVDVLDRRSPHSARTRAEPVGVIVVTSSRRSGRSVRSALTSGAAALTSPTETACTQTVAACGRVAVDRVAFVPALEILALAEAAPDQVVDGDRHQHVQRGRIQAAQQTFEARSEGSARIATG